MPLTTSDEVIAADVERVVAVLLGRNTDERERRAVRESAPIRLDREEIRSRLEHFLETGRAEPFKGYSNDYFVDEFAKGERAQAWHWLLLVYWNKEEAIEFAIRQIESANRIADNPYLQQFLEEAQLEAIAEMSRFYGGDCDVAASLADVAAFPYVLWRLHDRWFREFLACPAIVPPLVRRLAGEPAALPPPGGRADPPEFAMSVADLFRAIAPHLARYPELWDLISRSAVAHAGAFDRDQLKPFMKALEGDSRLPELLHDMCAQIPTQPRDGMSEIRNARILNLYMTNYCHLKKDAAILRHIATESHERLAREAIHWLAYIYHDDAGVAEFLLERMRRADDRDIRIAAFYCLMLYFGGQRSIADALFAQAESDTNNIARDQMNYILRGNRTYRMNPAFDELDKTASQNEAALYKRQFEIIRKMRSR